MKTAIHPHTLFTDREERERGERGKGREVVCVFC